MDSTVYSNTRQQHVDTTIVFLFIPIGEHDSHLLLKRCVLNYNTIVYSVSNYVKLNNLFGNIPE